MFAQGVMSEGEELFLPVACGRLVPGLNLGGWM